MNTRAAEVAKSVRATLKQAYPHTVFQVHAQTFAGGDAVNVGWTDGPTTKAVDALLARYESGSFDAMTDTYTYDQRKDQARTVKYVGTSRHFSPEVYAAKRHQVCDRFDIPERISDDTDALPEHIRIQDGGIAYLGQLVTHLLHQMDLTATTHDAPTTTSRKPFAMCAVCGAPLRKSETHHCHKCGRPLCAKHAVSYVDGNNAAITKHSPDYCEACYTGQPAA